MVPNINICNESYFPFPFHLSTTTEDDGYDEEQEQEQNSTDPGLDQEIICHCQQQSLFETITDSENMLYLIITVSVISFLYLILCIIIICKHRKIKKTGTAN